MDPGFVDNINAFLASGFGTIDQPGARTTAKGSGQIRPKKRRGSSKGRVSKTELKTEPVTTNKKKEPRDTVKRDKPVLAKP